MTKTGYPPNLPEIKEGIRIMWHAGYYDGPLSGVAMYEGVPHYFDCRHQYISREMRGKVYRTFWVYRLTDDEWKTIKYWHDEFGLHVGRHTDYEWNETEGRLMRSIGTLNQCGSNYHKEMYYDRRVAFDIGNGGSVESKIDRRNQVIGYVTWDVLFGMPWKPWRRIRKKKARERVSGKEEGA